MSDIWHYLQNVQKPIVIYGMGNGADKILDVFDKYGIKTDGIFASDGFVRGNIFRGFRIVSYNEIIRQFEDPVIILGFASHLPEVIDMIRKLSEKHELYAPDVPVYGNELFNEEYYSEHEEKLRYVRNMFCNEESKRIFDEVIAYRLDGKISHLFSAVTNKSEIYRKILDSGSIKSYADLGAYNGDTLRELLASGCDPEKVYCVEPDAKSFAKLEKYTSGLAVKCENHNVCAYDKKCVLTFGAEGNRGSAMSKKSLHAKTKDVPAESLDNILCGRPVDYIKYDVEGCECEALNGSKNTIAKFRPKLSVSLYHRSGDIFRLPMLVKELRPDYKFYLCRSESIPAWDLNLYAV